MVEVQNPNTDEADQSKTIRVIRKSVVRFFSSSPCLCVSVVGLLIPSLLLGKLLHVCRRSLQQIAQNRNFGRHAGLE